MNPGFFDAVDGLKLYGEWYSAKHASARGIAVVAHGYADHCGRQADVGRHLAGLGFHALAFDYRGHGQAGGRRGHCDRFDDYLADLQSACERARAVAGADRPILLVGHSHGGLIALRALSEPGRLPAGVRAVVVSSPSLGLALKVSPVKLAVGRLASRIAPRLSLSNGIRGEMLTHDAERAASYDADRFCHKVATARWFAECTAAQAYVRENASRIELPTLWLVAGSDPLCDAEVAREVYGRAGGEKHLCWYDGFFHEVFNEVERARPYKDLEDWVSARFPAA